MTTGRTRSRLGALGALMALAAILAGPSALSRLLSPWDEAPGPVSTGHGALDGPLGGRSASEPQSVEGVISSDALSISALRPRKATRLGPDESARTDALTTDQATQRFAGRLDVTLELVAEHVETFVGPIAATASGPAGLMVSDIDLVLVGPGPGRPYWYAVTAGLSDAPMRLGGQVSSAPYAELALALPASWARPQPDGSLDPEADPTPLLALLEIADLPARTGEGLLYGDAFPVSAQGEALAGYVVSWPMAPGEPDFMRFIGPQGEPVQIWGVYPLSREELALRRDGGMAALEALFDAESRVEHHDVARRRSFAQEQARPGAPADAPTGQP